MGAMAGETTRSVLREFLRNSEGGLRVLLGGSFRVRIGNTQTSRHTFLPRVKTGTKWRFVARMSTKESPGRYGGKRFIKTSSRRISTMAVRFMASDSSVARPVAVRPRIRQVDVNAKWSDQFSERGLNSVAAFPVFGSTAEVRADFRSEQVTHAKARLASSVGPCCERGNTWST